MTIQDRIAKANADVADRAGENQPGLLARLKVGDIALRVVAGLVLLYLFIPIAVIVAFSFNNPRASSTTPGRASRWTTGPTRSSTRR